MFCRFIFYLIWLGTADFGVFTAESSLQLASLAWSDLTVVKELRHMDRMGCNVLTTSQQTFRVIEVKFFFFSCRWFWDSSYCTSWTRRRNWRIERLQLLSSRISLRSKSAMERTSFKTFWAINRSTKLWRGFYITSRNWNCRISIIFQVGLSTGIMVQ